jgi:hypothetical protein
VNVLGVDYGERLDEVSLGQSLGGQSVAADGRLQSLFEMREALNVIDIGVSGDNCLAIGEGKIELPDQLENLIGRLLKANVDQNPFCPVEDQIHIAPEPLAGLVIDLDDVRKDGLARQHGRASVPNSPLSVASSQWIVVAVARRRYPERTTVGGEKSAACNGL